MAAKYAVVTGAASGIGRAVCNKLLSQGVKVAAADMAPIAKASFAVEEGLLGTYQMNVSKKSDIENMYSEIMKVTKRPPQILVNSAGITRDQFLLKLTEDDWDQVMLVNLKGTFLTTQIHSKLLIKFLTESGSKAEGEQVGSIVNLSSVSAKGNLGQANYAASKAGVLGFTKTCAQELGRYGIRVNAVLPGFTVSPMTDVVPEQIREGVRKATPMKRFGQPEEVADLICYLAGDESSFVTGASIECSGGLKVE